MNLLKNFSKNHKWFFTLITVFFYNTSYNKSQKNNINPNFNDIKKTKFLIYMAADNDLFPFAQRNLKQLENIGSNQNLKIYVHFDLHPTGHPKMTKRLIIEKGKTYQIGPDKSMDSGDPNTLIDFCKWAIVEDEPETQHKQYNHVLVLWNHGTGAIEPKTRQAFNPTSLWHINPETNLREVNREIGFFDFLDEKEDQLVKQNQSNQNLELEIPKRGICFDDTTGNYLENSDLQNSLHYITHNYLKKPFSIVAFDACLMSMIEVASYIKNYAHIAVGSQEVELGTGWDYYRVLQPFLNQPLSSWQLAQHIVKAYESAYSKITNDYTQSALDLKGISFIEENIKIVSDLLIYALKNQKYSSVKEAIRLSRNKDNCTHFDEPTYIDLDHFYANLIIQSNNFILNNRNESKQLIIKLKETLKQGRQLINQTVIANSVGKNLKNARGISIFFPERRIYSSYFKCQFALNSNWLNFIQTYITSK